MNEEEAQRAIIEALGAGLLLEAAGTPDTDMWFWVDENDGAAHRTPNREIATGHRFHWGPFHVPWGMTHNGGHIFVGRRDEVLLALTTAGFAQPGAEAIVRRIGTAPL